MVNIRNKNGEIIGRVNYSTNLDFYDGRNFSSGSSGYHKGLTKLRNGDFVLIDCSDWQGSTNSAEIISAKDALQEILQSGNINLLEEKKFSKLKDLYNTTLALDFSEDID